MCGIAGILDLKDPARCQRDRLQRMTNALIHRGPDDEGHYFGTGVALGARRLSIVDIAGGHQPLSNEDGSIWITFNGELFDHGDLRNRLTARGHRLATSCDTEVPVHLWEDHGEACLQHMKGQFALALWDEKHRALFLARDRFGIVPLYWAQVGSRLIWASEVRSLFASGWLAPKADVRGLDHMFTFICNASTRTMFEGVQMLAPGHYLRVVDGRIEIRKYWDLEFPDRGEERSPANPSRQAVELCDLIQQAVARRLRADVPVVSYLSGGIDSAVIAALIARERGPGTPAFTIKLEDPKRDESVPAGVAARTVGARSVTVFCSSRKVADTYPRLTWAAESPVVDSACACLLLQAQSVHDHGYKVVLSGEGADEALAGYYWFKTDKLARLARSRPLRLVQPLLRSVSRRLIGGSYLFPSEAEQSRTRAAFGCYPAKESEHATLALNRATFYGDDMWDRLDGHTAYDDLQFDTDRVQRWHPLNQGLYYGYKILLPGLLLSHKGDRVAMHSSVETRYPFLDEDVTEFLAAVHPRLKLRGMHEKYLLRRMASTILPRPIAERPKQMFRFPMTNVWLGPNSPDWTKELITPAALTKAGYFDPSRVGAAIAAYKSLSRRSLRREILDHGLAGVFAVQLWHHLYIDSYRANEPPQAGRAAPHSAEDRSPS